jgi:hypothetical protein
MSQGKRIMPVYQCFLIDSADKVQEVDTIESPNDADAVFRGQTCSAEFPMLPQLRYGSTAASSGISNERIYRSNASKGGNEMMRANKREHAMALQRIAKVDKRLATLEERIHALTEDGQPTIEVARLLQLMHRSRACMQEQADLFRKDKA